MECRPSHRAFWAPNAKKNWKMLLLAGLLASLTGYANANAAGAACIDLPSVSNCEAKGAAVYPSFPGASGPTHFPNGENAPLTPPMAALLQSLINDEKAAAVLPQSVYTIEIPGLGKEPDRLVIQGNFFKKTGFWIRSFAGQNPDDTVYLVSLYSDPTSLRAYRFEKDGRPEDVTQAVFPSLSSIALPAKTLAQYQRAQFSGLFIDDSRLNQAPVLRWIAETDPDNKSNLAKDTKVLPDSNVIHFGFLVWNGKSFDLMQSVQRAQWPCRQDRFSQQLHCDRPDPFVIE